ncbi:MAG: NUDIX hydrolase, partial [Lachnospiraceae bacterium]|nr:NUDIX hydrolase [Lachnospiraceae bacterium]
MTHYIEELRTYIPTCLQEAADQEMMTAYIETFPHNILTRDNGFAHTTASSMIINQTGDKVLMVYHNIYRSWAWTGGHSDGEIDPLETALREAREETGICDLEVLGGLASVDVLPVVGHMKRGKYISSHIHLNYSYLFEADDRQPLRIKEDENSQVGWIAVADLEQMVSEPDMLPIYKKLIAEALRRKGE